MLLLPETVMPAPPFSKTSFSLIELELPRTPMPAPALPVTTFFSILLVLPVTAHPAPAVVADTVVVDVVAVTGDDDATRGVAADAIGAAQHVARAGDDHA